MQMASFKKEIIICTSAWLEATVQRREVLLGTLPLQEARIYLTYWESLKESLDSSFAFFSPGLCHGTVSLCVPGHPDVEQACKPSVRTWSPNSAVLRQTVPPICPEPQGCYLELEFQYPVIPESLTIWVTFVSPDWDSSEAVSDIKLLMVSGGNISLGPQNFFCDIPMTVNLDPKKVNEEVYAIQIYTLDEHLEIDAAMMSSIPQSEMCANCRPIQYKIVRDPPFPSASPFIISNLSRKFVDS